MALEDIFHEPGQGLTSAVAGSTNLRPTMAHSEIYTVFCIAADEDVPFSVEIDKNKTVDQLKKLIKEERGDLFANIASNFLDLYQVDIPDDDHLDEMVNKKPQGGLKPLRPSEEMANVFSEGLKKGTVHILVQARSGGKSTDELSRL